MIIFSELTNLLPSSQVRAFRREYFLRLATTGIFLLAVVVFVGNILLLPSYVYERQTAETKAATLARLSSNPASSAEQEVQTKTKGMKAKADAIQKLSTSATASTALRAVLAVPRPGIVLTSLTFTPPSTSRAGNMQLSGVASTRENLRKYVATLGALPFVSNADLPISAYAQESSIKFTVTLNGTLHP